MVPHQGEQAEVDVADAGPFEVVEAVAFVEGQDVAQRGATEGSPPHLSIAIQR